jgi:hypothetical protein
MSAVSATIRVICAASARGTAGRTSHNPPVVAARLICTSDDGHAASVFPGTASSPGRNIVITAR